MATITTLSRLVAGVQRQVDLSVNTLVVGSLQVTSGGSILTNAILANLIALQNGTDFANGTNAHTHDARYFTKTILQSTTGGSAGSTEIGDDNSYSHFSNGAGTVKGALSAIDTALGTATNNSYDDSLFNIFNHTDITKKIEFDASGITTSTIRILKMADANVDLANLTNSNISASAAIAYSKLNLALSIVNADIGAAAAIAYTKLASLAGSTNAILIQDAGGHVSASGILSTNLFLADGSVAATGAFNLNSHKITNLTDPTSPQDAATKFYIDNALAGLTWKNSVRAASTANVSVSSAPSTLDGVTLVSGNRVLLKNQTTGTENGIYVFTSAGSALTRSTDMDAWTEVVGAVLLVTEGTVNQGSKWVNTNVDGGTIGTTAITFTAFSVAGTVNGTGTSGYVAYWNGTATLTAEQYLSASRGGLATDASAFTGVLKAVAGAFSASQIVNADVAAGAAIAYAKLALANSIVNADVATGAAIAYAKLNLAASIVNADIAAGAAISYSKLALTNSIVNADIAAGAAIAYSKLALTNSIVAGDLTANSVTAAKVDTTVFDQSTITGGSGSAAVVQNAPALKRTLVAGQSFTANTSYAVRWGVTANGETAGRVYAADTTTSSFDLFYVIGMASSGTSVTAGQNIAVTTMGSFALSSADAAFGSGTDGAPVFLTAAGTFSTTAPSAAGTALTRIGMVQVRSATVASNIIDVAPHVVGVN